MSLYASLDELSTAVEEMGAYAPEYWDKMANRVPECSVVDREMWLLHTCHDKTVLHLGCGGRLHQALKQAATRCYGIDLEVKREPDYVALDLDLQAAQLPYYADVELVLLPELLEHLTMPGLLLRVLKDRYAVPVIITVPNAFCPQPHLGRRIEMVNKDHVAWYSHATLSHLLEKCGYAVEQTFWYHGRPLT